MSKLNQLKYETAKEIGLTTGTDKNSFDSYVASQISSFGASDGAQLTASQAGSIGGKIGGNMVRKLIEQAENIL